MYYIISPKPLKELCKYEMVIKDKYGNRDYESFYKSPKGIEFVNINPLRIRSVQNKADLIDNIVSDLGWLSLCYNCLLYVYVLSTNSFYSTLNVRMRMYTNFLLCTQMQKNMLITGSYELNRIDDTERYYNADLEEFELDIRSKLKNVMLKTEPIWGFTITLQKGFVKIN